MTRPALLALAALIALAACGVDGPPSPPPDRPDEPEDSRRSGITISGSVGVGVTGGNTRVRMN